MVIEIIVQNRQAKVQDLKASKNEYKRTFKALNSKTKGTFQGTKLKNLYDLSRRLVIFQDV